VREEQLRELVRTRVERPEAIAEAAARRVKPSSLLSDRGRLMMIAADHPARGALAAGDRPLAMADRAELLDRLVLALSRPGVNGVLGTPDIVEDLLLLGALDGIAVFGSMNRGGLAGAAFEIDDRFTGYDAAALDAMGYEGGKMLLRVDLEDPATAPTLEACGHAVSELAERRLVAMVEPFMSHRTDGRVRADLSADATIFASVIAAGLGEHVRVHVAEDPGRGGDGACLRRHDAAPGPARRRGARGPGRGVRILGQRAGEPQRGRVGRRSLAAVSAR
jgi:hypothetical protein